MNTVDHIKRIATDLKQNITEWNFSTVFKRKGVQAVCGYIEKKLKTEDEEEETTKVVYKISAHPDRTNEHEEFICSQTNQLREVSPHFVASYGSCVLPITNKFIEENSKHHCKCENCTKLSSQKDTIFTTSSKCKPRHTLFLEYVSSIHLKHALRTKDDRLSTSQLVLCLAAIQQGIDAIQFCHYDLHIDNILLKECDPHSYFAYRFKNGETILCPTRGYYPVFIDFGTSYTYFYTQPDYKNKSRVSIVNSHYGLQPTLFDRLADIHQLIISALYECQLHSDTYYALTTHVMHHFRQLPLYRETGWKKCPFDVFVCIENKIDEYEPILEDECPIWSEKRSQLIDILSLGITLPFKQIEDEDDIQKLKIKYNCKTKQKQSIIDEAFTSSFKQVCLQLTNIQRSLQLISDKSSTTKGECKQEKDSREIYYILREIIECETENSVKELKTKYKMGKKCNISLLYQSLQDCCKLLSHLYEVEFSKNKEVLDTMYSKLYFQSSTQIANYLLQHVPIRPTKSGIVDVHCFDIQTMTTKVLTIDTTTYKPGKKWREETCQLLFSSF